MSNDFDEHSPAEPVETFATDLTVVGALKDWPATDDERRKAARNQRRAIAALNDPL